MGGWDGFARCLFFLYVRCIISPKFSNLYNYKWWFSWILFKCGKGIIDKGHFFPYPFILEMEAFINITRSRVSESQNFPSQCAGQWITYLTFLDGIIIFVVADLPLKQLINDVPKEFNGLSKFFIIGNKSGVFCAAVTPDLQPQILFVQQFKARLQSPNREDHY